MAEEVDPRHQRVPGGGPDERRWPETWMELAATGPWKMDDKAAGIGLALTISSGGRQYRITLSGHPEQEQQTHVYLQTADGDYLDGRPGLTQAAACRQAAVWAENLALGRSWWLRPVRPADMGDFFTDRAWSPPGARLHILLRPDPDTAAALADSHHGLLHGWSHVLSPVPADKIHLTLAWLPAPVSSDLTSDQRTAVQTTLRHRLAELPPVDMLAGIEIEPARIHNYGLRCALREPEQFHPYAWAATNALREVFGAGSVPDPRTDPHIALAYGTGGDVTHLQDALRPIYDFHPLGKASIVITDADTFTPTSPWTNTTPVTP